MTRRESETSKKSLVQLKSVHKRFGDNEVLRNVSFDIYEGEFLSFLGPSGCGKTTCLRILAGFEEVTGGEVWINGKNMLGIPPNKRDLSMVFQNYSLFPHMNVFENVAFGLKERKESKTRIRQKVGDALELVQMSGFEKRKPGQLSGGQKQRVAIARSLVLNPTLLLLDEPLGALDLKLRKQMQAELKALQNQLKITFVYVTHDQEEALTMSARIVVLDLGAIQQIGTPFEIYNHPVNRFVADFIGETTFLEGEVVRVAGTEATVDLGGLKTAIKGAQFASNQKVILSIRPESVKLGDEAASLENRFEGRVFSSVYKGALVEYHVTLPNGQRIRAVTKAAGKFYKPEEAVWLGWAQDDVVAITNEQGRV